MAAMILAIFHLHVNLLLHWRFQLNSPYGAHHGFPIDKILAHFDPEVVLLLWSKFRFKSTKDVGRDVKN